MILYILVFAIFLINVYSYEILKFRRGKRFFYILECIILILLYGLRFRVGGDSLSYEDMFDTLPHLKDLPLIHWSEMEYQPGWYIINALIKEIGDYFVVFQLIHALIVNISIFVIVKKYCYHPFTGVLLYYFFLSLMLNTEVLRESLAIVVFLFALDPLFKKKWLLYFTMAFVAYMIHAGALFMFVLPLFINFLSSAWKTKTIIILAVSVSLLIIVLQPLIGTIFNLGFISESTLSTFYHYHSILNQASQNKTGLFGTSLEIKPVLTIIIYAFGIYALRLSNLNNWKSRFFMNSVFLLVLLAPILGFFTERWRNYFDILFYCTIADMMFHIRSQNFCRREHLAKPYIFVFIAFLTALQIHDYTRINGYTSSDTSHFYNRYIPYYSIFDPQFDKTRENMRNYEYIMKNY